MGNNPSKIPKNTNSVPPGGFSNFYIKSLFFLYFCTDNMLISQENFLHLDIYHIYFQNVTRPTP